MQEKSKEFFIIVDVETAGPNPGLYALLSIGACTLHQPRQKFYVELKPDRELFVSQAMKVNQLSLTALKDRGSPALEAMQAFANWLEKSVPLGSKPIFTAFNAPFDWMFVCDYFLRYLGKNPFGYKALDIKAYFMGLMNTAWENTSHTAISQYYGVPESLSHHALEDAVHEAMLFEKILLDGSRRSKLT